MLNYYKNKKVLFILDNMDDLLRKSREDSIKFLKHLELNTNSDVKFIIVSTTDQNLGLNEQKCEMKPLSMENAKKMVFFWTREVLTGNFG